MSSQRLFRQARGDREHPLLTVQLRYSFCFMPLSAPLSLSLPWFSFRWTIPIALLGFPLSVYLDNAGSRCPDRPINTRVEAVHGLLANLAVNGVSRYAGAQKPLFPFPGQWLSLA